MKKNEKLYKEIVCNIYTKNEQTKQQKTTINKI